MAEDEIVNPANGNWLPHLLLPLSQLLAMTLPPFRYREHIFIPIIASLAYATYTNQFSNTVAGRALAGIHWTVFLGTIEKLMFGLPENDYWRLDRPYTEAKSMPFGFRKLHWATSLALNQRGIGWNYQVKGVPNFSAPQSKWPFIFHQFWKYVQYYVISDLLHFYFAKYHYLDGVNIAFLDLRADSWTRSFCNALCAGAKLYFPIQMNYSLVSILSVLIGLCQPKDWPPLFGRIQDVTTVRDFWGSFWHQLIRKVFASYSEALVRLVAPLFFGYGGTIIWLLGLPPRHTVISYFKLYSSFAISGITHGLMTWCMPANREHTFHDRFLTVFTCFIGNAVAIHFEDVVMAIYRNLGGSKEKKLWKTFLGYTWVTCWIWLTCCWGATSYLKMGMTGVNDVPFPFAQRMVGLAHENLSPFIASSNFQSMKTLMLLQNIS